jgi:hypothetical protein
MSYYKYIKYKYKYKYLNDTKNLYGGVQNEDITYNTMVWGKVSVGSTIYIGQYYTISESGKNKEVFHGQGIIRYNHNDGYTRNIGKWEKGNFISGLQDYIIRDSKRFIEYCGEFKKNGYGYYFENEKQATSKYITSTYLGNMENKKKHGKYCINIIEPGNFFFGEFDSDNQKTNLIPPQYKWFSINKIHSERKKKIYAYMSEYKKHFNAYVTYVESMITNQYTPNTQVFEIDFLTINDSNFWEDITKPFTDMYNEKYACKKILVSDCSLDNSGVLQ